MKSTAGIAIFHTFLLLVASLAACSTVSTETAQTASTTAGEEVGEIMPGLLEGYIPQEEQLDSKVFVLPSPASDSAVQALDTAWAESMLKLRGTARWDLAIRDANLYFPAAADAFSCSLGIAISEEDTPSLYMLLRRTLADAGLAPYSAKKAYQRVRPFMVNGEPICTPDQEEWVANCYFTNEIRELVVAAFCKQYYSRST